MSRPHTRSLALLFVVALVALAGCNGIFGSDGGSGPTTDTEVTPVPLSDGSGTATATPAPEAYPPGVNADGVTNLSALRRAHAAAVNDSVTVEVVETNERVGLEEVVERTYVENATTYLRTVGRNGTPVTYADSTGLYLRSYDFVDGEATNLSEDARVTERRLRDSRFAGFQYLDTESAAVDRVERDGAVYYRVHASRPPASADVDATNYSVTAYVRADGFVRTIVAAYDVRTGNETHHFEERHSYVDVGNTTAPEPDWVRDEKRERGLVDLPPATPAAGAPPGIGERRLYNVSLLWDAHREALENRSFTLRRGQNGTNVSGLSEGYVAVENRTTYAAVIDDTLSRYGDATGHYVRYPTGGDGDEYVVRDGPPRPYDLERTTGHGGGFLVEYGSSVTRLDRNDTTYFRIDVPYPPPSVDVATENYSATALVREDGLVERVSLDLVLRTTPYVGDNGTARQDPEWAPVEYEYVYTDVGNTAVDEPAWVTRFKRNRTTATDTDRNRTTATDTGALDDRGTPPSAGTDADARAATDPSAPRAGSRLRSATPGGGPN